MNLDICKKTGSNEDVGPVFYIIWEDKRKLCTGSNRPQAEKTTLQETF